MIYGVPFIELNSKARVPLRGYGRDKTRLSFVYTVGLGEETPPGERLAMAPNTTINLNGATIRDDATALDAVLMPVPRFGESMSAQGPSAPLPEPSWTVAGVVYPLKKSPPELSHAAENDYVG